MLKNAKKGHEDGDGGHNNPLAYLVDEKPMSKYS